jgi:ABC-type spermidine/putrescine transport system permease subunit II
MFRSLGMIGSYWALILTHAVITMPIVICSHAAPRQHPRSVLRAPGG